MQILAEAVRDLAVYEKEGAWGVADFWRTGLSRRGCC